MRTDFVNVFLSLLLFFAGCTFLTIAFHPHVFKIMTTGFSCSSSHALFKFFFFFFFNQRTCFMVSLLFSCENYVPVRLTALDDKRKKVCCFV